MLDAIPHCTNPPPSSIQAVDGLHFTKGFPMPSLSKQISATAWRGLKSPVLIVAGIWATSLKVKDTKPQLMNDTVSILSVWTLSPQNKRTTTIYYYYSI